MSHLQREKSVTHTTHVEGTISICMLKGNIKDKHYAGFDVSAISAAEKHNLMIGSM